MMEIYQLIYQIGRLSYDDLLDLTAIIAWTDYDRQADRAKTKADTQYILGLRNQVMLSIRGRHATPDGGGGVGWQYVLSLPHSKMMIDALQELDDDGLKIIRAAVHTLADAKRPRAATTSNADGETVARGSWSVKKKMAITKDENGVPMVDDNGNPVLTPRYYRYLRVYVTSHDGTKRNASIYIGSLNKQEPDEFVYRTSLAIDHEQAVKKALERGDDPPPVPEDAITREMIVEEFQRAGYDGVKAWRNLVNI